MAVEVKVTISSSVAAKKSAVMKWSKRSCQPVSMVLTGKDTVTEEAAGLA